MSRLNLNEFCNEINIGEELNFNYGKRDFSLSQAPGKIFIVEVGKEDVEYVFKDAEDLAENFIIDGKKFKDIIDDIEF